MTARAASDGRVRQPGGGRKKVEQADPALPSRLKAIVEEATAGDPMSPLRWQHLPEEPRYRWRWRSASYSHDRFRLRPSSCSRHSPGPATAGTPRTLPWSTQACCTAPPGWVAQPDRESAMGSISHTGLETVLHTFQGGPSDGANPEAGLVRDAAGNITTLFAFDNHDGEWAKVRPLGAQRR
jgi:hypothetical protein